MIGVLVQMARYRSRPRVKGLFYRSDHVRGCKGIFLAHAEIDLALNTWGEQMGPIRAIRHQKGAVEACCCPADIRLRGRYFHHVPPRGTPYRIAIAVQFGLNVKKIV